MPPRLHRNGQNGTGLPGRLIDEADIAAACGTAPLRGTQPERAVEGVQSLGFQALWFENADLDRLQDLIEHDWPVIVFLRPATCQAEGRGCMALW